MESVKKMEQRMKDLEAQLAELAGRFYDIFPSAGEAMLEQLTLCEQSETNKKPRVILEATKDGLSISLIGDDGQHVYWCDIGKDGLQRHVDSPDGDEAELNVTHEQLLAMETGDVQ